MPKQRSPDSYKAEELYKQGKKLVEIASQLNIPEGTVRRWKSTYKWDTERSDKNSERSHRNKSKKKEVVVEEVNQNIASTCCSPKGSALDSFMGASNS